MDGHAGQVSVECDCDASREAAAAAGNQDGVGANAALGELGGQFKADGALAGNDRRIVEGPHECQATVRRQCFGPGNHGRPVTFV